MKLNIVLKHFGVTLFFFVIVFFLNKIPTWYIISWWDFYQLININENLDRYLFTWFNHSWQGQFNPLITTYPFYYIQKLLYSLWLSYSQIASFLIFQFLILSFYSFYISQKILFISLKYTFLWPLLYSLNLTTIAILFYPWIISHHFLIYIFIPLLLSLFLQYLIAPRLINKEYAMFILLAILSLPAYNNISFFFALLFVEWIIFLWFILWKHKDSMIYLIKKGFLILCGQLLVSLIVILPFLSSQISYKNSVLNTKAFAGDAITNIMKPTSSNPLNTFRWIIDNWRYPNIALEHKFKQIPDIFIFLSATFSFILIIVIILWLIKRWKESVDPLYFILLGTFLTMTFLVSRLTYPFEFINTIFYKDLTLWLFRSPDKLFIFIPFLITYLLVYSIDSKFKDSKVIYYITILSIILSTLYVYSWWIVKQYLVDINWYRQWMIRIPDEYYDIQKIINKDTKNTAILSLPYSVVNSLNWSNYQKWWYIWHDLLHLLYNKNYIYSNWYDHPVLETVISTELFSKKDTELAELVMVIKKFWVEYIINHKDIDSRFIWAADLSIQKLIDNDIISEVYISDYFTLYEVWELNLSSLIHSDKLSFKKINPTQYHVNINQIQTKSLYFKQSHNPEWKLYLEPYSQISCSDYSIVYSWTVSWEGSIWTGSYHVTECPSENQFYAGGELAKLWQEPIFDDTHKMVYDYANQWTIDPEYIRANYPREYYHENPDGTIDIRMTLYFRPQSYFYLWLFISGSIFFLLITYFSYNFLRRKKVNKIL